MNSTLHTILLAVPLLLQLTSCASGGQKTYYPDGTLKSVRTPNFHETYHENGKVKERIALNSAGQRYGNTIEYLSDGRAWSSRPYRNGEANGTEYRLYPQRTPVCSWQDGIVRSVYQDGGWVTRDLTPAEQASIERREEAERLRVEMAMRKAERDEESRQNTLAALQTLSAGLQSLNSSSTSSSSSSSSYQGQYGTSNTRDYAAGTYSSSSSSASSGTSDSPTADGEYKAPMWLKSTIKPKRELSNASPKTKVKPAAPTYKPQQPSYMGTRQEIQWQKEGRKLDSVSR